MPVLNAQYAVYYNYYSGPTFGYNGYSDLYISDSSNTNRNSNSYALGTNYQLPSFLKPSTPASQSFIAGSTNFQTVEIEVYTP